MTKPFKFIRIKGVLHHQIAVHGWPKEVWAPITAKEISRRIECRLEDRGTHNHKIVELDREIAELRVALDYARLTEEEKSS